MKLYEREINASIFAMATMNAFIHDMEAEMFKTLLHNPMTGKVRVNELAFSPPKEGQT